MGSMEDGDRHGEGVLLQSWELALGFVTGEIEKEVIFS